MQCFLATPGGGGWDTPFECEKHARQGKDLSDVRGTGDWESELKLQRQLDRARSTDLVERVEAAVGAARS